MSAVSEYEWFSSCHSLDAAEKGWEDAGKWRKALTVLSAQHDELHHMAAERDRLKAANAELAEALKAAQQAINSMKTEAENGFQGDEEMMFDAMNTISNEGLAADIEIRAALTKHQGATA